MVVSFLCIINFMYQRKAVMPLNLPQFHHMIQLANGSDIKLVTLIYHFTPSQASYIHASTRVIPFDPCKCPILPFQHKQTQKHTHNWQFPTNPQCNKKAPLQSPLFFHKQYIKGIYFFSSTASPSSSAAFLGRALWTMGRRGGGGRMPAYISQQWNHSKPDPKEQQQSETAERPPITSTSLCLCITPHLNDSLPTFNRNSFTPSSKGMGLYVPS